VGAEPPTFEIHCVNIITTGKVPNNTKVNNSMGPNKYVLIMNPREVYDKIIL